jgi:hypothetical protein
MSDLVDELLAKALVLCPAARYPSTVPLLKQTLSQDYLKTNFLTQVLEIKLHF